VAGLEDKTRIVSGSNPLRFTADLQGNRAFLVLRIPSKWPSAIPLQPKSVHPDGDPLGLVVTGSDNAAAPQTLDLVTEQEYAIAIRDS
jgi:hypothetical protein